MEVAVEEGAVVVAAAELVTCATAITMNSASTPWRALRRIENTSFPNQPKTHTTTAITSTTISASFVRSRSIVYTARNDERSGNELDAAGAPSAPVATRTSAYSSSRTGA